MNPYAAENGLDTEITVVPLENESIKSHPASVVGPKLLLPAWQRLKIVLFGSQLYVLYVAILASIVMTITGWNEGAIFSVAMFSTSLLGIAPLAERLGFVTEQLANYTGPTVSGLVNATFGNVPEMLISLFALKNGMIRVVQLSLLGSILSNMLLVLGCAFLCGGWKYRGQDQKFNKGCAVVNSWLLLMAVMGLLFPAVLQSTHTELHDGVSELLLSRFSSCVMLFAYASYLYFQLKSHRKLYEYLETGQQDSEGENRDAQLEDSDEEKLLYMWESIAWIFVLTVLISILSENMINTIEGASQYCGIPVAFISVIVLPIVGNAAEHASAVLFALKDKLDISLGVAIGSSTQISMFVIPLCVVVGWIIGVRMDLNFQLFETATLFITVIVVAFMLQEGKSNYIKGLMLVLCYLIVAASFLAHDGSSSPEGRRKVNEMNIT